MDLTKWESLKLDGSNQKENIQKGEWNGTIKMRTNNFNGKNWINWKDSHAEFYLYINSRENGTWNETKYHINIYIHIDVHRITQSDNMRYGSERIRQNRDKSEI